MGEAINSTLCNQTSDPVMSHIAISHPIHHAVAAKGKEADVTRTILWKGTPITALTAVELRQALADALSELDFSRKVQSSDEVFSLILSSFLTGVVTALVCLGLPQLIFS